MPQMRGERKKERERPEQPTAVSVQDLQKDFHQTGAKTSRQHESTDGQGCFLSQVIAGRNQYPGNRTPHGSQQEHNLLTGRHCRSELQTVSGTSDQQHPCD